ncbi:DUF111 family protein [Candidatus Poribacteria bacterium]|nr:DUF111 family protein [Candidatus Poribacteria bacterium]
MEQTGTLILAQVDHLTGEEMGFAIDQIMSWGANNVYIFPGITKKNRSGCVILVDIDPGEEAQWAGLLAEELSIYGYHRILTSHYCSRCRVETHAVIIRKGRDRLETEVHFKTTEDGKTHGRIEHADLVRVREKIKEKLKIGVPLSKLRTYLESRAAGGAKCPIEINL